MANPKFRLSLTQQQIAYLYDLVENDQREITAAMRQLMLGYLMIYKVKVSNGLISSAYAAKEKLSLEDQLGATDPATRREVAYKKYQTNPELCSQEEILAAKTYMFENGMMTAEEEASFLEGN